MWGCPPHHCLHLLPGLLHQTLQATSDGELLEALPQSAEGMGDSFFAATFHVRTFCLEFFFLKCAKYLQQCILIIHLDVCHHSNIN